MPRLSEDRGDHPIQLVRDACTAGQPHVRCCHRRDYRYTSSAGQQHSYIHFARFIVASTHCATISFPHDQYCPTRVVDHHSVAPERVGRPGLQSNRASHWRDRRADVEHRGWYAPAEPGLESGDRCDFRNADCGRSIVVHRPGRRHSRTSGCTSLLDPYQPSCPAQYYNHVPSWRNSRPGLQPNDTGNRRDRNTSLEKISWVAPRESRPELVRNHFRHADQSRHFKLHGEGD